MLRMRGGLVVGLALGMGVFGCGDDDVPGLGGESGSTEEPRRVSGAEAQEIAEAITIEGADVVRKALPDPSDSPATPAVRSLPKRDIGLAKSRLDLDFQAESREDGGELRGVYLQLEGADFYWDIPKRSLKQNRVTATDDVTVEVGLPDVSPGIEFCFTVCVYSSENLVSQPQTTCITVPNLGDAQNEDIQTICDGLETCDLAPTDCVEDLTRDVASIQAFADGCAETVADTTSCVAGAADDCEFLASVFGDESAPTEAQAGTDTGAMGGTSSETGGEPTGSDTGGTSTTGGTDTGSTVDSGDDSLDGGVGGATSPTRSVTSAVAKQSSGTCEKELTAFAECVADADGSASGAGGGSVDSTGGSSMTSAGTGVDTGGEVDCSTSAVQAFADAVADVAAAAEAAAAAPCEATCTIEADNFGTCFVVSDGADFGEIEAGTAAAATAYFSLSADEQSCVSLPMSESVCDASVSCVQGFCQVGTAGTGGIDTGAGDGGAGGLVAPDAGASLAN